MEYFQATTANSTYTGNALGQFQIVWNPPYDPPPMGVREPRRPIPSSGPSSTSMEVPVDYPTELHAEGIVRSLG